jgi:hypothetical protein
MAEGLWSGIFKWVLASAGCLNQIDTKVLSSWTEIGYRVGNLAAGAGALYLADRIGWRGA